MGKDPSLIGPLGGPGGQRAEFCPDCHQALCVPAVPVMIVGGRPVWCATCENCHDETPPADPSKVFSDQLTKTMMQVHDELRRAMQKFPRWPTDPLHALSVLQEEIGELAKATLQRQYEPNKNVTTDDIRSEAIQCAAMCLRFLLSLHRYEFHPGAQHRQE